MIHCYYSRDALMLAAPAVVGWPAILLQGQMFGGRLKFSCDLAENAQMITAVLPDLICSVPASAGGPALVHHAAACAGMLTTSSRERVAVTHVAGADLQFRQGFSQAVHLRANVAAL